MLISRRSLLWNTLGAGAAAAASTGLVLPALAGEEHVAPAGPTPAEALAMLKAGNRAFVSGRPARYPFDIARRREIARGQHPFATIVCCSDSRVGPEQIFETGLGQLFVIRNAGSTAANAQAMGSIEYSVEHLGVPLVVVLGHSKCGAVKAATEVVEKHAELPGSLAGMVEPILASVEVARTHKGDLVENTVHENVLHVAHDLRAPGQPILAKPVRAGKVKVMAAVYDLETGIVTFIDEG
jgi:carbonic anhydrase